MDMIQKRFQELNRKDEKALMPYFTAGFPSVEETVEIVVKAQAAGADLIELGVPFSDPIADGPIIQYSSFEALKNGVNTDKIFGICRSLKQYVDIPYLLMTYYNPVYRYGLERFVDNCCRSGVAGLIIPDLPYEEALPLAGIMKQRELSLIPFITPFTGDDRAVNILKGAGGFVYFVTVAGVTGPRSDVKNDTIAQMKRLKRNVKLPVSAGFGISETGQILKIKPYIDGVIVGSLFTKKIIDGKMVDLWQKIREFKEALM